MPAVENVLVIGAGAAGTATAILLAEGGVRVDLIDVEPDLSALGSGITLQGNALRVLRQLGVWHEIQCHGFAFDELGLRAPDAEGTVVALLEDFRTGGPDLPATLGMYRPTLARILLERAVEVGVKVRFGSTCTALVQDELGVSVTFADQDTRRYDLVVGADGVRSSTRRALGIELETLSTGMGIWRTFTPRPASVTHTDLYYGGACYIAGYSPTSEDSLYAYLVEDAVDRSALTPQESLEVVRELAAHYHGPWDEIATHLTDPSRINYTWFETHLLPVPWHRGRVVLVGDAVHACPPTIAQGAAQALEDAVVLSELLLEADRLSDGLLGAYAERRMPRANAVVDASVQVGTWLLAHDRGDVPGLMREISQLLAQPA